MEGCSGLGRALTSVQTQPGQLSTAYTCIPYQYTQEGGPSANLGGKLCKWPSGAAGLIEVDRFLINKAYSDIRKLDLLYREMSGAKKR